MPGVIENERMLYFPLERLLQGTEVLNLDTQLGVLSLLSQDRDNPIRGQVQLTAQEMKVVLLLLQSYPGFCPDEVIWACINRKGQLTDEIVASARARLQEAMRAGVWDHEMRQARNILSRARLKLKTFEIGVGSVIETGYLLIALARA